MVSHWSLSDNKSPQVSRTPLSILNDLNNVVVWIVSTHPLISKFSSPFISPFVTVLRVPITIGITVTFIFHSFFNSLARFNYLSFLTIFQFYFVVCWDSKVHNFARSLFFLILLLGLVVWPRLGDPFICQNPIGVCASHSQGEILGCAYIICLYGQI